MVKTNKKKGFTIVELVIVIAVIAILSAVLIPTFTGLVESARKTAEQENMTNAYQLYASKVVAKDYYLFDRTEVVVKDGDTNYACDTTGTWVKDTTTTLVDTLVPLSKDLPTTNGTYVYKLGEFNGFTLYGVYEVA